MATNDTKDIQRQLGDILKRMRSRDDAVRDTTEKELRALGPAGVEALMQQVAKANAWYRMRTNAAGMVIVTSGLTMLVCLSAPPHAWWVVPVLVLVLSCHVLMSASRRHRFAVEALATCDDVGAVAHLVTGLDLGLRLPFRGTVPDRRLRAALIEVLTRLLPKLSSGREVVFSSAEQSILLAAVTGRRADIDNQQKLLEFRKAAIRGLAAVGDSWALKAMERYTWYAESKELAALAEEVITAMRARIRLQELAGTLLRPATAPDAPSETLLRPARGVPEADPALPLRPAQVGDDPTANADADADPAEVRTQEPQRLDSR